MGEPRWVIERLSSAGCVAAAEEAAELVAAAPDSHTLERWVARREAGEPLAWITGVLRFCGLAVAVDQGVYVPRLQSEDLARRACDRLSESGGRAADLCSGAGPIAAVLRARVPRSTVVGVDIDPRAVACAARNGVLVVRGDLDRPLRSAAFDVVTAVAPYVPAAMLGLLPADVRRYEPAIALEGGDDGLDILRRVVAGAARLLRRSGWLLVELGGDQDVLLAPALEAHGFSGLTSWFDDDGDLRGLEAQLA